MLGPRHLPSYLEVVNFENDLEKHHKKLGQIHNGQKKKLFDKELPAMKTAGGREKVIKFHNSEKALAIEKDNELLLGRLVEISRKKQNPVFAVTETQKTNLAKSLNEIHRKKEKDRIAAENEAFARRLLSQQPSFNRRKLDEDFDRHAERVKLMQKWVGHKSKVKLPPIQYSKYEDDVPKKSQSGKEKKSVKDLGKKKKRKSNRIDEREEIDEEDAKEREELRKEIDAQELKELQEKFRQEEMAAKEKEARELQEQKEREEREKEEAEREAKEELERAEKLKREEEERLRLEEEKKKLEEQNAKPKVEGNPMVGLIQGSAGLKK